MAYTELSSLERKAKEWLYPYPDFITKRPPYDQIEKEYNGWEHRLEIDLQDHLSESLRMKFKSILTRGFEKWSQERAFSVGNYSAAVVDVGQHQRSNPNIRWYDAMGLGRYHHQARTIYNAKKRFQYVQMAHSPYFMTECWKLSCTFGSRTRPNTLPGNSSQREISYGAFLQT